jgi:type IV secretory pathway TrbF-like protein
MTVFDGYVEDYNYAREEALKAVDEYAHASDPGTQGCEKVVLRLLTESSSILRR